MGFRIIRIWGLGFSIQDFIGVLTGWAGACDMLLVGVARVGKGATRVSTHVVQGSASPGHVGLGPCRDQNGFFC